MSKLADLQKQHRTESKAHDSQTASARLEFLMQQAEVFSHFMSPEAEGGKGAAGGKKRKKAAAGAGGGAGGRRAVGRKSENEEDEELVAAAMGGAGDSTRLTKQPSLLVGGTLRDYQLEGLNWLINLYDTGINGILAEYVLTEPSHACCLCGTALASPHAAKWASARPCR